VDKFSTVSHSIISGQVLATNVAKQQRYSTFHMGSRNYESQENLTVFMDSLLDLIF